VLRRKLAVQSPGPLRAGRGSCVCRAFCNTLADTRRSTTVYANAKRLCEDVCDPGRA
jgi:hypothetical protein